MGAGVWGEALDAARDQRFLSLLSNLSLFGPINVLVALGS